MAPEINSKKSYGFAAISKSLKPFLIGKGVRLFVSVAVILLLARVLEEAQYAVYVSLTALVTIVGAVSSIGIQQSMLRYIPELRASGNNQAMYWMFIRGMLLRVGLVGIVLLIGIPFAFKYGHNLGLDDWLWVVPWYAGVGVLRLGALSLSQSLEALLWQKQAQYGMAIGGFVRLMGIVLVMQFGQLDLWAVVLIELVSEGLSLVIMTAGWFAMRSADVHKQDGSLEWWPENRKRVYRFGAWSGLMNQTRMLYGSSPNRLMTAHYLGSADLALFGFADSLNNLATRLMPTKMMMSMIRPVFIAKYSEEQDFSLLSDLSNLVYRLNLSLLALPIALLLVAGEPVLSWLTAGKYGEAAYLLAGFLALMLTEGMRTTLELLVQAVEKNQILLTNLIQSVSLFVAIPLFPILGLWALIVVNLLGTMVANFIVVYLLGRHGHDFKFDWALSALVTGYAAVAGGLGYWVLTLSGSYIAAALVTTVVFAIGMVVKPPLRQTEKDMLMKLIRSQRKPRIT
ncbi:lipopolysaccharide biosynthesis protein [Halioxenophilus aromaticivorans]